MTGEAGRQILVHRRFAQQFQRKLLATAADLQFVFQLLQRMLRANDLHRAMSRQQHQARRLAPPGQRGDEIDRGEGRVGGPREARRVQIVFQPIGKRPTRVSVLRVCANESRGAAARGLAAAPCQTARG